MNKKLSKSFGSEQTVCREGGAHFAGRKMNKAEEVNK